MPHRTILISQQSWQTFCENFPSAAQWLMLELNLERYNLPSLTPHGEPLAFALPQTQGEPTREYPGN